MEGILTSGLVPTFFYEQTSLRRTPRRYKKSPDELPADLRFAHFTPRIAAYLAGKERDKAEQDAELSDGLGNKSLLTQINATVTQIQNTLNSALTNDEDSQRYVFEKAKVTAASVIAQLARILYLFEGVRVNTPTTLENQLLSTYRDLTTNVHYVPREWQVPANREEYLKKLAPAREESIRLADDAHTETGSTSNMSRLTIDDQDNRSVKSATDRDPKGPAGSKVVARGKALSRTGTGQQLQDIAEVQHDGRTSGVGGGRAAGTGRGVDGLPPAAGLAHKRESREKGLGSASSTTMRPKTRLEKFKSSTISPSVSSSAVVRGSVADSRTTSSAGGYRLPMKHRADIDTASTIAESVSDGARSVVDRSGYWSVIQFQLSSQQCEDKGWIIHPTVKADRERETLLEWATQRLQLSIKHRKEHDSREKEAGRDKPIIIRYYGDSKRDYMAKYGRRTPSGRSGSLLKGQTPQVPDVDAAPTSDKKVFMTSVSDGSTTIYYPSGRPAILASCCPVKKSGFYTIAFDDTPESRMLAVFTPSGRGCCYHGNGVVSYLATDDEWTLSEESGAVSRRSKWPSHSAKMAAPIVVQLNPFLTLRSSNHTHTHLYLNILKETAKVSVGQVCPTEDSREESVQLLSGLPFTSQTAKEHMKPQKPRVQVASKVKVSKSKGKCKQPPEIQKLLDMPEVTENDAEADKVLFRLQRKIRNLVEDWLEHYRLAIGMTSPHLRSLQSAPPYRSRDALSAKSSPAGVRVVVESLATHVPKASVSPRVPSAPAGRTGWQTKDSLPVPRNKRPASTGNAVTFNEVHMEETEPDEVTVGRTTPHLSAHTTSASPGRSTRARSAPIHQPPPPVVLLDSVRSARFGGCPAILRNMMVMTGPDDRATCRCSRHRIPYVTDIEYDEFIQRQLPPTQLVVISVVSSLFPSSTSCTDMLDRMYSDRNRSRTQPCIQARSDPYRVFMYDVATAAEYSGHSTPLLLRRHNIVPGMFLMYENGKLVFCDHIFNGYGNARKDFQKQLMVTRRWASLGHHLPRDFRFSPQKGRHGPRAAWGGEIGGAGVDHHGNAGLSVERRRGSLSSLSSGDSKDVPIDRHLAKNKDKKCGSDKGRSGGMSCGADLLVRLQAWV